MDWKLNRNAKKPIYKQIAEYIESGIEDGTFLQDVPLPSERALANQLQVNRSTVVAAYDELEANGLIERKKGSGTTISKDIWGVNRKRVPSWNRYIEAGSFLPNVPVIQRIRKEMTEHKLINLASGELSEDLFPVRSLREMMSERCLVGGLGYDHPQGNQHLRETIVSHVREYRKIDSKPSSILITSGAQQALYLVVQCLLKPGDAVAIENPSYSYSLPIFQSVGVRTFDLPLDEHGINPEDIVSLYKKHRIRMIFLNPTFQNPTGTLLHSNRRKRILEISSEYGIPIIEDDPYGLTAFNGEEIPTLKSMDENGNVLYISSLSKIVASGLRIGWIIGLNSVIERMSDAKQQIDFGHGTFNQWITNDFLSSDYFHSHISSLRKQLERRRNQMVVSLKRYLDKQVDFHIPEGGIHLWCKVRGELNEMQLLEESIKRGVIYAPGSTLGSQKNYIRFTFAREREDMIDEGIKRFAEALKSV